MSQPPRLPDTESQVKQALRALEKMQAKLDSVARARTEPIAIVGVSCRFPGAKDPESFWELLRNGVDAIGEVPPQRWDMDALYDKNPDAAGKMYTRWCGLIDDVDQFDPAFFGISPREAVSMDPQQRLLLEVAWEAIERAGYTPERLSANPTGVYVGASSSDYVRHQFADLSRIDAYVGTGSAHSILANRLSYFLDLQGPSMAVDTACSSSLVAAHLACQSLRAGECRVALAGGVNLILSPEPSIIFSRSRMMAFDGRCKTFDSRADGYVRGEGCGVVVLKRLSDAQTDGDPILAVIRGSAVNQDGRSNGLAAPNVLAQQRVIRQALNSGSIEPRQVGYIEAHGTGTALGDPIEVEALSDIYGKVDDGSTSCLLASVKTNIGHLEAAAGIAGLIKAVLCLQHHAVPQHLHFRTLNPNISFERTRFAIPTELRPWPSELAPLAAVSSFGFGGTNAHVILGPSPTATETTAAGAQRPHHVLTLSAKTAPALKAVIARYEQFLGNANAEWADICATANSGRAHFAHRFAVVAADANSARQQLAQFRGGQVAADRLKTAFLFTGQGSQYAGMGAQLYRTERVFRDALDRCSGILKGVIDPPLTNLLFASQEGASLHETRYTQPALFAFEWSLAQLWLAWGIQPDCLLGHSLGELVAACVASVFSLEDGLRLVAERGRLASIHASPGSMAAIFADADRVQELVAHNSSVAIAAENCPFETVIAGASDEVTAVVRKAEAAGLSARMLQGSMGFHSPLMNAMLPHFAAVASTVSIAAPRIPLISNRTGMIVTREELAQPDYWVRQLRERVRFSDGLKTAIDRGVNAFIEVGPHPTLLNIQQKAYPDAGIVALPSLRKGSEDSRQLFESLARLHAAGGRVDWASVDRDYARKRVVLPTYPFQRTRYWLDAPALYSTTGAPDIVFRCEWRPQLQPELSTNTCSGARWIVIADTQGFADALADQLRLRGEAVLMTSRESLEFGRDPIRDRATTVIDCSALDASTAPMTSGPELVADITALCGGILRVVQRIVAEAGPARLWLLTRSAQAVNEPSQPSLRQAPVWGLGRVIAHEHSANWGGLVDLDPLASPSDAAKDVVSLLLANTREDQWAIRGGHPYAPRLVRYLPSQGVALALDSSTTYLITGGLGRIGLSLAEWLVRRGARHLALVSRRAEDSASKARLNGLRSQFRAAIDVYSADVADPAALQKVLRAIADSGAPLRGVIHCAGVLDDGVVLHQDESRLTRVLAAKAGGAWELHAQTAACDLQFFILCSSAAGLFGSPGQSNYAAANVFLDSLANWRRAAGLPGLSVQWGPWDIGMGQSRRNLPGVDTLDATTATAVLEQLLAGTTAEAAVLRANWPGLRSTIGDLPFLSEVAPQRSASVRRELQEPVLAKGSSSGVFAELMGVVDDRRPAMIRAYLESRIQAVIRASEPIGDTQRILDLGMDSLMIVEVLNECRRDLQIALYPREMYSLPNFGALAAYLAREFDRAHKAVETEAFPSGEVAPAKIAAAPRVQAPAKRNRSMVFLLSSPRAGSTLLRVMLAGHPLLFSPPELHLLAFDTVASWYRTLSVNDLNEGLERALMELMSIDAAGAQGVVQAMVGEDVAVYDVYAKLQELAGTRTLVDKSPTYGASIETLRRAEILFEEARYIHLVRHPHAVIESFVRNRMDKLAGIDTNDPYGVAEQAWVTMNRNIHQFFQEVDSSRCYLVRYEDLVTQPAPVLQKLCVFLNIPFDPALLQPYEGRRMTDGVHAHSYPIGDPSFSNHSDIDPKLADAWRSAKLPRVVGPEAQQLARTFGYSIETGETKSVAMRESWRDVRGARLCICEWGPEQGPIVLCLHGILEHGGAWELVAARLAGRGFHVIAPDLRGHGRSDHAGKGSSYHLLDFLADVDAIARSIGQPFRLVGHSMGTAIAAMFASSRPEQVASLVLVEPPSSGLPSNGAMSQLLAGQLDHLAKPQHHSVLPDVAAAAARLRTATPSFPLDLAEQAAIRLTEPCDGGVRWRWDAMLNTRAGLLFDSAILTSEAFGEIVRNIAAPTTLVYGDRSRPGVYGDGSRPGSEAAANDTGLQIPGARRVVLAGGHNLHIEAAADLADVIAGL